MSREDVAAVRASVRKFGRIPALVTTFCAFAFIGVAAEQVGETQIRRFGDVGRSLSEREITRIEDLANAAGKPAWLVLGFPSMIRGVTMLTVYLRPDVTSERVSRGRMLQLVANDAPVVSERSDWSVKGTFAYAYVPLVGPAAEIASDQDLAWPFTLTGRSMTRRSSASSRSCGQGRQSLVSQKVRLHGK